MTCGTTAAGTSWRGTAPIRSGSTSYSRASLSNWPDRSVSSAIGDWGAHLGRHLRAATAEFRRWLACLAELRLHDRSDDDHRDLLSARAQCCGSRTERIPVVSDPKRDADTVVVASPSGWRRIRANHVPTRDAPATEMGPGASCGTQVGRFRDHHRLAACGPHSGGQPPPCTRIPCAHVTEGCAARHESGDPGSTRRR